MGAVSSLSLELSEGELLLLLGSLVVRLSSSALLERLSWSSTPIVLGLGHSVSQGVLVLSPVLAKISSTLDVPLGVVFEDSGLRNVSCVVIILLLLLLLTDIVILFCR